MIIEIREFDTIDAGFDAVLAAVLPFPFIVRQCQSREFVGTTLDTLRTQIRREASIVGYADGQSQTGMNLPLNFVYVALVIFFCYHIHMAG